MSEPIHGGWDTVAELDALVDRRIREWRGYAVVPGPAATKGSWRAIVQPKTGKQVFLNDNKRGDSWEIAMRRAMHATQPEVYGGAPGPWRNAAVVVEIVVFVRHPASHYGKDGRLKATVPPLPVCGRDADKVARICLDAAQGAWYDNDSRVVWLRVEREWEDGGGERTEVRCRVHRRYADWLRDLRTAQRQKVCRHPQGFTAQGCPRCGLAEPVVKKRKALSVLPRREPGAGG